MSKKYIKLEFSRFKQEEEALRILEQFTRERSLVPSGFGCYSVVDPRQAARQLAKVLKFGDHATFGPFPKEDNND